MPSSVSAHRLSGGERRRRRPTRRGRSRRRRTATRASSLAWPPGPWPQSWPRAIASVSATLSPSARATDGGDLGDLEGVGEPGALVVVGEDEHLGLAGQAAERAGVQDAVAVALEAGAPRVGLPPSTAALAGAVGRGWRRGARRAVLGVLARLARRRSGRRPGARPTSRRGRARTSPAAVPGHRGRPSVARARRPRRARVVPIGCTSTTPSHGSPTAESHRAGHGSLVPSAMAGFVDECALNVRGGDGGAGCVRVPARGPGRHGRARRRRRRQGRRRLAGRRPQRGLAARLPRPPPPPGRRAASTARARTSTASAARTWWSHVPEGTVVQRPRQARCSPTCVHHGDRWLAAAGGRGGRGNAKFLSNRRRAPALRRAGRARRGALAAPRAQADGRRRPRRLPERRQEHADLRASRRPSRRSPTTRSPRSSRNLGVVRLDDDTEFVVADIPGLIEGASEGKGLGHQFLRHVERARVLCLLLDLAAARRHAARASRSGSCSHELGAYRPELLERPRARRRHARPTSPAPTSDRSATASLRRSRPSPATGLPELVGRAGRRSSHEARAGRAGAPRRSWCTARCAEGFARRARGRRRVPGASGARPSGPSPSPTSPTPRRLDYVDAPPQAARRRPGLARAGAQRRRHRAHRRASASTTTTGRADAHARRRQDRHVVDHRRRRARSTTAAIAKLCARGRRAARPPATRCCRRHLGRHRRRPARARA